MEILCKSVRFIFWHSSFCCKEYSMIAFNDYGDPPWEFMR